MCLVFFPGLYKTLYHLFLITPMCNHSCFMDVKKKKSLVGQVTWSD